MDSAGAVRFERRRVRREREFRYVLTFGFDPQPRDVKPQDVYECRTVQKTPSEACVLAERQLAVKFGLPSLDGERTVPAGKAPRVLGNDYHFYRINERYWLSITPLASPASSPLKFGFALSSPEKVFSHKPPSLFETGCEIKRNL
jgi:hypothetical protein